MNLELTNLPNFHAYNTPRIIGMPLRLINQIMNNLFYTIWLYYTIEITGYFLGKLYLFLVPR